MSKVKRQTNAMARKQWENINFNIMQCDIVNCQQAAIVIELRATTKKTSTTTTKTNHFRRRYCGAQNLRRFAFTLSPVIIIADRRY